MIVNPINIILSLLPLISFIDTLNFFNFYIIVAILKGIILILILSLNKIKGFVKAINIGANNSVTAMINTSAAVGFGTVVQAVPGFQKLSNIILGIERSEERRVGKEWRSRKEQ